MNSAFLKTCAHGCKFALETFETLKVVEVAVEIQLVSDAKTTD